MDDSTPQHPREIPPGEAGDTGGAALFVRHPGVWRTRGELQGYLPYASWGRRVLALVVDVLLVVPIYFVMGVLATTSGIGAQQAPVTVADLLAVGFLAWNVVFRQGRTGCSIGKQSVGIRLLGRDSLAPVGTWSTFVRGLAHIFDALPFFIGILWPIWDGRKQTFADKLCHTIVVRERLASR